MYRLELSSQNIIRGNFEVMADDILTGLKYCTYLKKLEFNCNIHRDESSFVLLGESWKSLHTLELNECIRDDIVSNITNGLTYLQRLEVLKISGNANYITEHKAKALTTGIQFCTSLRHWCLIATALKIMQHKLWLLV